MRDEKQADRLDADGDDPADPADEAFLDFWERRPPGVGGTSAFNLAEAAFAAGAEWSAKRPAEPEPADPPKPLGTAAEGMIGDAFRQYLGQALDGAPAPAFRAILEVTFYAGFQAGAGNAAAGMRRFYAVADAATQAAMERCKPFLGSLDLGGADDDPDAEPDATCPLCGRPDCDGDWPCEPPEPAEPEPAAPA